MRSLKIGFLTFLIALSSTSFAEVWRHRQDENQDWSERWEWGYSQWVEKEFNTQWLKQKGFIFENWSVDCAKLIYLMRLYYSYKNGLEFRIHNPNGTVLSSKSNLWDQIRNPEERLKAFARLVFTFVNTQSLQKDTYLVSINRNTIRPGIILSSDFKRGHNLIVTKISDSGVPTLNFGTLPGSEYIYESYNFPPSSSIFPAGKVPTAQLAGFRQFRWPQFLETPEKHSDYSLEQSAIDYSTFFDVVIDRIRLKPRDTNQQFRYSLDDLCMKMRIRTNVVIDGEQRRRSLQGQRMTAIDFDLYSTVKRDEDLKIGFEKIDRFYFEQLAHLAPPEVRHYQSLLKPTWTAEDFCWVNWATNRNEPLGYLRLKLNNNQFSSDPNDSFSKRWGEEL